MSVCVYVTPNNILRVPSSHICIFYINIIAIQNERRNFSFVCRLRCVGGLDFPYFSAFERAKTHHHQISFQIQTIWNKLLASRRTICKTFASTITTNATFIHQRTNRPTDQIVHMCAACVCVLIRCACVCVCVWYFVVKLMQFV